MWSRISLNRLTFYKSEMMLLTHDALLRNFFDRDIDTNPGQPWQVYSTGHSLGGALATLFALELSSSKLAK